MTHMPPVPLQEAARLEAMGEYAPSAQFDDTPYAALLELARDLFEVPIAYVSLLERDRQVIPARSGLSVCETSRKASFCAHAVAREEMLVVLDATVDPRFANSPLVIGSPYMRFYAGTPLVSPTGYVVGTLCLADTRPHDGFSDEQRRQLGKLGDLVLEHLEMRRLEKARDVGKLRFESIAATSPDGIICANQHGRIVFWNAAAERMLGYSAQEAIGRSVDLIVPERVLRHQGGLRRAACEAPSCLLDSTVALTARHKDGTEVRVELSLSTWHDGDAVSFAAILRDASNRLSTEERLLRLAHNDPLTELPNRAVLRRHVERLGGTKPAALLLLDLDGFKAVNDDLGHAAGDAVLREVARRLVDGVRAADTVARLGGDEFAILLAGVTDQQHASDIAWSLVGAVSRRITMEGGGVSVGASVGIALHPGDGADVTELTKNADLALYRAKAQGRRCVKLFTPALRRVADRMRAYDDELRTAFEKGEFEVFYQPQVRVSDGALIGAEALLRWHHPRDGLVAPNVFMAALDRSPISVDVGRWVLHTACAQAALWRAGSAPDFRVAVNLFGLQFAVGNLAADVHAVLAAADLPASALELEITENTILRRDEKMLAPLQALRDAGVSVAFDDYGTGYGSLSMLRRFPITRLKIDKGFVEGMCTDPADAAIVRSVLFLARSLDIAVIAEGVETKAQLNHLRSEGCTEAQGYLFGRPMSAQQFDAFMSRNMIELAKAKPAQGGS